MTNAPTITPTESDVFVVLAAFLQGLVPTGVEVIRGQINRVPEPTNPNFIIFWPIGRVRLSTNTTDYTDGFPNNPSVANTTQRTQLDVQIDVHGPLAGDMVQIITTLFRDLYASTFFDQSGIDAQILCASDPRQIPFINAENQYEDRWSVDISLQVNQTVQVSQEFADSLFASLYNVEAQSAAR